MDRARLGVVCTSSSVVRTELRFVQVNMSTSRTTRSGRRSTRSSIRSNPHLVRSTLSMFRAKPGVDERLGRMKNESDGLGQRLAQAVEQRGGVIEERTSRMSSVMTMEKTPSLNDSSRLFVISFLRCR